ncbi:hypothetical protein JHN45_15895 [Streptomyces sp. MBT53]|nr:hypothetical protein [Streptomyces sp. MBT53]
MDARDLLILKAPEITERLSALNDRLAADRGLRELYIRNPTEVIVAIAFPGANVKAAEASRGNRLLFSLLTNERFVAWARQYHQQLLDEATSAGLSEDPDEALRTYVALSGRSGMLEDLVVEVARVADPAIVASLHWRDDRDHDRHPDGPDISDWVCVEIALVVYAVAVFAVFVGLPLSTGLPTGFSRLDVSSVALQLTNDLRRRGATLRESGTLTKLPPTVGE